MISVSPLYSNLSGDITGLQRNWSPKLVGTVPPAGSGENGTQGLPAWEGSPSNTRCLLLGVFWHHVPGISLSLLSLGPRVPRHVPRPTAPIAQLVLIPSKTSIYLLENYRP